MLERRGIISGYEGSKPRRVLVSEGDLGRVFSQPHERVPSNRIPPVRPSNRVAEGGSIRRLDSMGDKGGSVQVMRRLPWAVLLLVALVLAVAAAGGGDDDETSEPPAATGGDTGEEPAAEPISVGLVSDTGGLDDRGFNEFSINGFERAQSELGVEGMVYTSESADDYLPNLTAAVDDGHDLWSGSAS